MSALRKPLHSACSSPDIACGGVGSRPADGRPDWFARAMAQGLTEAHWRDQAQMARAHAKARPPADIRGYCESACEGYWFDLLADIAADEAINEAERAADEAYSEAADEEARSFVPAIFDPRWVG